MSNDFFEQVTKAEEQAKKIVEDAKQKMHTSLISETADLEKIQGKNIASSRENSKKKLAEKQKEMRTMYDGLRKEGVREVQQLENSITPKMDKPVSGAFNYLLEELL